MLQKAPKSEQGSAYAALPEDTYCSPGIEPCESNRGPVPSADRWKTLPAFIVARIIPKTTPGLPKPGAFWPLNFRI